MITDPTGRTLSFDYDGAGRLIRVTDAAGNSTSYAWDNNNRIVAKTDPLGRTTRYGYDADGRAVEETFADGEKSIVLAIPFPATRLPRPRPPTPRAG